jgi:ATP-dependent Lon protease
VPAGAQPKEGPSAGVALTTAIVSAFTNRKVRKDVAMTGEITLRGKVLPIGGLKAKAIAAHRAGIGVVIFPKENAKDLPDIPSEVRADLEFVPAAHIQDVLAKALLPATEQPFGRRSEDGAPVPVPAMQDGGSDRPIHV